MDRNWWLKLFLVLTVPGGVIGYSLWWICSCHHKHVSFPMTIRNKSGRTKMSVTCFDCAKKFEYNWITMKMGKEIQPNAQLSSTIPGHGIASLVAPVPKAEERFR
jgi:hypothetical protein